MAPLGVPFLFFKRGRAGKVKKIHHLCNLFPDFGVLYSEGDIDRYKKIY